MPFGTCTWVGGTPQIDFNQIPKPELRHETLKWFVLLKSFGYLVPHEDPAGGTIFIVPGADAPRARQTQEFPSAHGGKIILPPHQGGRTDLASVPAFMWWLIASYGNHTRAALLHDALVPEGNEVSPVARTDADRLLLAALREPGQQKRGAFRHWLMWAAASVFGTLRPPRSLRPIGIVGHVFASWALLIAALFALWGAELTPDNWIQAVLWLGAAILAIPIFLIVMGSSWRAGANVTGGWLPTALLLAPIAVLLAIAWPPGKAFWLLLAALALVLLGHVWGFAVDRTLRWRLWPTSVVGLPVATIPVALIFLSIFLVWLIDLGASIAASFSKEYGRRRGFELPTLEPYRKQF
jgi:Protein of unknown function (DUF1353)